MGRPQRHAPSRPSAESLRVLVVDDDAAQLEIVERILVDHGHRVTLANRVAPAIELLNRRPYDVLITDLVMPETSGVDLACYVRENNADIGLIVMSGYHSIATALDPAKVGTHAFLKKPFSPEDLTITVDTCTATATARRLSARGSRLRAGNSDGTRRKMIGKSPAMQRVFDMIPKIAPTDEIVLLEGESGTGKGLLAEAIHRQSPRSSGHFVVLNCGATSKGLIESKLFGHLRGSFTDAHRDHKGCFAQADGGTLLLDEIADLPLDLQVTLLRVLETGRIPPIGAEDEVQVDVRVIAATNKNLAEAVARGEFRQDLFYRLDVARIETPPLRDRGRDINLLFRHFLDLFARERGREPLQLTDAAKRELPRHRWPGNVRELENVAKRLALLCESDVIDVDDLRKEIRVADSRRQDGASDSCRQDPDSLAIPGPDAPLSAVIRWHCRRALRYFLGNKSHTAESLRIQRQTLNRHLDARNNRDETRKDEIADD